MMKFYREEEGEIMSNYEPGDLIEYHNTVRQEWIPIGTYIGTTITGSVVCEDEYGEPRWADRSTETRRVRPFTPPIEIPEGWTLMRSDELEVGVHEMYDPGDPLIPWIGSAMRDLSLAGECLVVARRRDQKEDV